MECWLFCPHGCLKQGGRQECRYYEHTALGMEQREGCGCERSLSDDAEVLQYVSESLSRDRETFKGGVQQAFFNNAIGCAGEVFSRSLGKRER